MSVYPLTSPLLPPNSGDVLRSDGDRFLSARKRRVYLTGTCPLSDMIWVEGWCEDQEPFITEWGQECIMLLANHKGDFITKILTK